MKMYDVPVPVGPRILVEVTIDKEKAIKSDIFYIPEDINNNYNTRVMASAQIGKILDMGGIALEHGLLGGEDELKPGHLVLFLQNAGSQFKHKDKDKLYRMITRGDIMAIVGESEDE